jgi:hypothetical protein
MAVHDRQATGSQLPASMVASERRSESLRQSRAVLQLKAWGMDCHGKPFTIAAKTVEVSAVGARLTGIDSVNEGEVIGIQYGDQKARFRVIWVGQPGTEKAGQIGVKSLDESKCIWSAALDAQPQAWGSSAGAATVTDEPASETSERRRSPRYACQGEIQVKTASKSTAVRFRLTDIGMGGCYAETMSPLPLNTALDLVLKVAGTVIPAKGVVRTSHVSMGMGIEFVDLGPEQTKELTSLLAREFRPAPPLAPEVSHSVTKSDESAIDPSLDALVRLLQKKGLLSRAEFLGELQKP